MIDSESSISISRPPVDVFAFADDPANAQLWLESAVAITQTSPGPRTVGTSLRYVYRQGGRDGEMTGAIAAREYGRLLQMRFADRMFDVAVGLRCDPRGTGTLVTHSIGIEAKGFVMKLFSPLIRRGNRRQVEKNLARLRAHLEG